MTDAELIAAAREWLIECYPDEEDDILESSADRIRRAVARDYDGGWPEFVRNAEPVELAR